MTPEIITVSKYADSSFWNKYHASPYLGCFYQCVYCYNLYDSDEVQVKEGAPEKFAKELRELEKDVITIGDYQPLEEKFGYLRKMLEVILKAGFPVHLIEKSPLVLKDLDLVRKISQKSWAAVSVSVTCAPSDEASIKRLEIFEPLAPSMASRWEIMREFSQAGILTGTCLMPIIPYIGDREGTLEAVVRATKEAGGKYLLWSLIVLPEPFDVLFWQVLEENFPDLAGRIQEVLTNSANYIHYASYLKEQISNLCKKYEVLEFIPRPVAHFPSALQLNKKVAQHLYLKAQENTPQQETYFRAACVFENLSQNVLTTYRKKGLSGLVADFSLTPELAEEVRKKIEEDSRRE